MYRTVTRTAIAGCAALLGVAALCWMIAPARADTVTDWNAYASTAIVANAGQPSPAAVLSFAMVQGAVYDAVNAIDRGHRPYLTEPPATPSDSKDAAAATAAFRVLVAPLPDPAVNAATALRHVARRNPGHATRHEGGRVAVGDAAAAAMLAARADDGRFGPFIPVIGTTPGVCARRRRSSPPTPLPGSPTYDRS